MLSSDFLSDLKVFVKRAQTITVGAAAVKKQKEMAAVCARNLEVFYSEENANLGDYIEKHKGPGFTGRLFEMIDARGLSDKVVYHKAGIDRRLFSKIRSDPDYHPSKATVIALGIALEADLDELEALLSEAGYALSSSETFDLIIRYCVEQRVFDLDAVNEALDSFQIKPLGGVA
ncbi:hypothetical protein [Eubacterium sp. 1001713B170207_170306_E7]|uniref:hypothetical protein n=1 Tax=Eubacterium sp. 1001713B170207_170306_E7 TaxID=2787097 RepID=UPI001899CFC6|nr:hypothetical protein [Eubacterium sp. 1001713B170207_170306_E7]